jgi:hypothetical protein
MSDKIMQSGIGQLDSFIFDVARGGSIELFKNGLLDVECSCDHEGRGFSVVAEDLVSGKTVLEIECGDCKRCFYAVFDENELVEFGEEDEEDDSQLSAIPSDRKDWELLALARGRGQIGRLEGINKVDIPELDEIIAQLAHVSACTRNLFEDALEEIQCNCNPEGDGFTVVDEETLSDGGLNLEIRCCDCKRDFLAGFKDNKLVAFAEVTELYDPEDEYEEDGLDGPTIHKTGDAKFDGIIEECRDEDGSLQWLEEALKQCKCPECGFGLVGDVSIIGKGRKCLRVVCSQPDCYFEFEVTFNADGRLESAYLIEDEDDDDDDQEEESDMVDCPLCGGGFSLDCLEKSRFIWNGDALVTFGDIGRAAIAAAEIGGETRAKEFMAEYELCNPNARENLRYLFNSMDPKNGRPLIDIYGLE